MQKNTPHNLRFFEISQQNPEKMWDDFYIFDEPHPDIQKYLANTREIKNILVTIRTLQQRRERKEIIEKYFITLADSLGKFSNCSEFACFINACDSVLKFAKKDPALLERIVQRYFDKRILSDAIPEEWVQAILDTNSSRKKGQSGERKLLHLLNKCGFVEVKSWEDFSRTPKCAASFSKVFSVKNIRKNLHIKLATKKQNKKLDLIIKKNDRVFLCEAKHLNTSGGGQDKQISELIEIISLRETNSDVSYVAFLDGHYSNVLLGNEGMGKKLTTQREEIKKYLSRNLHNYWVNTAGFKELFHN